MPLYMYVPCSAAAQRKGEGCRAPGTAGELSSGVGTLAESLICSKRKRQGEEVCQGEPSAKAHVAELSAGLGLFCLLCFSVLPKVVLFTYKKRIMKYRQTKEKRIYNPSPRHSTSESETGVGDGSSSSST